MVLMLKTLYHGTIHPSLCLALEVSPHRKQWPLFSILTLILVVLFMLL
jgi:hypothetical protein